MLRATSTDAYPAEIKAAITDHHQQVRDTREPL